VRFIKASSGEFLAVNHIIRIESGDKAGRNVVTSDGKVYFVPRSELAKLIREEFEVRYEEL
jgi:hypothetical protein